MTRSTATAKFLSDTRPFLTHETPESRTNNVPMPPGEWAFAKRMIHSISYRLIGRAAITSDDLQDLRQDMLCDLCERMSRYRPELGELRTFITHVVQNKVATILKERRAKKRGGGIPNLSLDWESEDQEEDGDTVYLKERYSVDDYLRLTRVPGRTVEEQQDLIFDLRRIIACLHPHEQVVCLLLIDNDVSGTSSVINIPRSTLRDLIKKLRVIAEREGLGIYFK